MILPAYAIAAMLGMHSDDNTPISTLLIDSRDLIFPNETLFFALKTSGNDGHLYIKDLIRQGVKHFLVSYIPDNVKEEKDCSFWVVEDVLAALQTIATKVRDMFPNLPVIGITGSRGKTVVKEMLFRLLRDDFFISRSPRSYNSQIGVPISIWELDTNTTLAIFEAGISQPGEMQKLQKMIQPTIGIFTSLTDEHNADFSSLEEKAKEKALLFVDCQDIFYPKGNSIIKNAITEICPKANLHEVEAENESLAKAVAKFLLKHDPEIDKIAGDKQKVSPRIDVCETIKDCTIVYDSFTNDIRSVGDALNFATKHTPDNRNLVLILKCPFCQGHEFGYFEWTKLKALLEAKGVKRFLGIGFPSSCTEEEGEWCESVKEFLDNYTISDFQNETLLIKGDVAEGFEEIKTRLESPRHETVMEVDLGAIANNFNHFRSMVKPGTGVIAMVKASAYGMGALEISKAMQSQGAAYLAVAVVDEGAELRRGGITMPIIVMNPLGTNYKALFDNRLEPSIFSLRELQLLLENAQRLDIKDYPVHIKLDTGMHRLGFLEEEIPALLEALSRQSNVKVASIFSHLATADCLDQNAYTELQLSNFKRMSDQIMESLPYKPKRHILNTAGIMRYPEHHYDMVRLGIGLYGVSPVPELNDKLSTVAHLTTTIISLKEWNPGTTIGYGRRGKIDRPSVIATIPIGYADGLNRHLSRGNGSVMVNGKKCPIVGNICMDQCMIDVTDANAQIGDKVEIFGNHITVEEIAKILDTIPYEVYTSVSPRVKRIYFRE